MKKMFSSIIMVCFLITTLIGHVSAQEQEMYNLNIDNENTSEVCIIQWKSEYQSIKRYEYSLIGQAQIDYFIFYLNALELVDDEKTVEIFNGCNFSFFINYSNGMTRQMGVYADRIFDKQGQRLIPTEEAISRPFFDSDFDYQYEISRKEYHRFFELIEAMQSGDFVVPEEFSLMPSPWAAGEVDRAIEAGLVQKVFQIDYTGAINRVEVCQLIVDLLEQHGYTEDTKWYDYAFEDSISYSATMLHNLGIVNGKTETQFCPYDPITRQELAKLLSNTYRLLQGEVPAATGELPYADRDRIGAWAVESVSDMLSLGILRGNDRNEFQPERMVTKEEVILALLRLHEAVGA